ncbi:hypothetical protein ACFQFC_33065 [Amorphoplanes digitatis]|uniref:Uncharacterized protein n=1 Tax=Actinoplanes digitatis TaxID=1868 RepID=A0A7W7HUC2_9ACTN|nr:hypothetical protein [Actinoplanes digitatis]MBB4760989.1 hypothetical protein [Actinoplanes digitatis]GID95298.1 hypothetical protein Adi01nite_47100 [Actinoplanes digitatis]
MNDLDDLRDAMNTPDFSPKPLDLGAVMAAGGRLRRRRRLAVGATSGLAVLALLVGGAQLARPDGAQPVSAGSPGTGVNVTPVEPRQDGAFGDVVDTGMTIGGGPRLLWVTELEDPALPDTGIGIAVGRRDAGGGLVVDVMSNESVGSDRAPGFHAAQAPMTIGSGPSPAFGYYVGDAAKITVTADGKKVTARQATWSEDPSVVLFWFTLDQVAPGARLGKLSAHDRDGRRLPAGNASFGVG